MPPVKHALLGASKAHQWLNCTPSVKWELQFPDTGNSDAAAEGTLAHEVAETRLRALLKGVRKPKTPKRLTSHPMYTAGMEEYTQVYTDEVIGTYYALRKDVPDTLLKLEQPVDYSYIVPEGHGTSDAVIISDDILHVFDLKYGKGVPVSAKDNPQLRLYALGALHEFEDLYDIRRVSMHIVQPRLDSVTEDTMTAAELRAWGESIKPKAEQAAAGVGEFNPSEDACRWCRCKMVCKAYAEWQLSLVQCQFDDLGNERNPNELTPDEIGQIAERADDCISYLKRVKEWMLEQTVHHGVKFAGWKVVEGRSNRRIEDEPAAIDKLMDAGFSDVVRLKGLTDLEEIVGKKKLAEILDGHIIKPEGKPTLAREDDKRPEINTENRLKEIFKEEN